MPRRGENIYKRKDGRWEARYIKQYSPEGKAMYAYLYANSYRDVKIKLQLRQQDIMFAPFNTNDEKNPVVFKEISEEWIDSIIPQIKDSTKNKYRNLLDLYIYPRLGNLPLQKITNILLEKYCNELLTTGGVKGTGLSPKTVADVLSVIRSILRFAVKNGETVNCDGKSIHVKQTMNQLRVLSRKEQARLLQYLYEEPNEYNLGILVCLFTGLRLGEICALKWEDISFTDQVIHIQQTMQRIQEKNGKNKTKVIISTPKSACSIRSIPIPDALLNVILTHASNPVGFFLTNSAQQYVDPRTMQNRFKHALEVSNITEANFHALRHTFATRCIEMGFDVKCLSEILGHASVNITMNRYVHPSMDLKKENMQRLSELFAVK